MKEKISQFGKWFQEDRKKIIILGISIIVFISVIFLGIILFKGSSKEEMLKKHLEEMGVEFYEELYYKQVGKTDEERAEFLKKFTDLGIKVNLDSLSRYNTEKNQSKISEFKNPKTNEECDKENSKVIIYPQEPFGQKDYRVEINLECGF